MQPVNVRISRIKRDARLCITKQREMSVGSDLGETLTTIGSDEVVYNRKDEIT